MVKKYSVIDGLDEEFTTIPTTNENITKVCTVVTQATFKPDDERIFYAQEGEIQPDDYEQDGSPVYVFKNLYNQGQFPAALSQVLFFDFPEVVKFKKGQLIIADEEIYAKINRGVVKQALGDFMGEFVATPYEVKKLLNTLGSGQIQTILKKMKELHPELQDAITTNLKNGNEAHLSNMDTGKD